MTPMMRATCLARKLFDIMMIVATGIAAIGLCLAGAGAAEVALHIVGVLSGLWWAWWRSTIQ